MFIVLEVYRAGEMIHARFGGELGTHKAVLETVQNQKALWPEGANVLFVVDAETKINSWSLGKSQWTTIGLRYLADNGSLLGMVAPTDWLRMAIRSGFVAGNNKRDSITTGLENIGLRADSPLFVYASTGPGRSFEAVPIIFLSDVDEGVIVESNRRPVMAPIRKVDLFSKRCEPIPGFVVFLAEAPKIDDDPLFELFEGPISWNFTGEEAVNTIVDPEDGELFFLGFKLRSSEAVLPQRGVSESHPPMPLRARSGKQSLAVYQSGNSYSVLHDGRLRSRWYVEGAMEGIEMSLYGRQGCRIVLALDGKILDFLPGGEMVTDWTLGKGIQQRYWAGEIEDWRFYKAK